MRSTLWHKKTFELVKASVKEELDASSDPHDSGKRLRCALHHIESLRDDLSSMGALYRYIYIISALVHHERHGGLSPKRIEQLFELCKATLTLQGIKPESEQKGYLLGDLYLVMSQINRKKGYQLKAIWGQQTSLHFSHSIPTGGKGFQSLALAIRALRMGHTSLCLEALDEAQELGLPSQLKSRVFIHKMSAYRLSHRYADLHRFAMKALPTEAATADEIQEYQWEKLCSQAQQTGDIEPLLAAVYKGRTHHAYDYLCEAFLWTRLTKSRKYLIKYPTLRSLARDGQMKTSRKGSRGRIISVMETLYDSRIPQSIKLEQAEALLSETHTLLGVDLEILVWAAVARWLSRSQLHGFARIVLCEYKAKSLKLTNGKSQDVLGALEDLVNDQTIEEQDAA